MLSAASRYFSENYQQCAWNIFKLSSAFNLKPTRQQAALFLTVQRESDLCLTQGHIGRITVRSGHGTGKTAGSGIIAPFRTMQHPGGVTRIIAPGLRQAKDFLMEFRRQVLNADAWVQHMIQIQATRVYFMGREDWYMELATASDPKALQGLHNKHATVIQEEASGIDREIDNATKSWLTTKGGLILKIGNPNLVECAFYDSFKDTRFKKLKFDSRDSPIVEKDFVDGIIQDHGIESDEFAIRVAGDFPSVGETAILRPEWIRDAQEADIEEMRALGGRRQWHKQMGVDFAREGGDANTIVAREGCAIIAIKRFHHIEPEDCVNEAFNLQEELGWHNDEVVYVADAVGIGGGMISKFHRARKHVFEFYNQGEAYGENAHNRYRNDMTKCWFEARKLFMHGEIYIPKDRLLVEELRRRKYDHVKTAGPYAGFKVIERKDEFKKRILRSPDTSDAMMMATFDPPNVGVSFG